MITKASKWYPGDSGGVPAVAGLNGADLALNWSLDELGGAPTTTCQTNHRLVVADEGEVTGWDYRVGTSYAYSHRDVGFKDGFVSTPGLYAGVANGTLNPFGPQDAAGAAYLESISADGKTYREADVRYYGGDFNLSRTLCSWPAAPSAIAVGGDWHRETYRRRIVHDRQRGRPTKSRARPGNNPSGSRTRGRPVRRTRRTA